MTPATYRNGGAGATIRYATGDSSLGRLLVAATDHGVCSVKAGRNDAELVRSLRAEFPRAEVESGAGAKKYLDALNDHLSGQEVKFPLDIRGTDFQMKVWTALRDIPMTSVKILWRWKGLTPNRLPRLDSVILPAEFSLM